MPRCHDSVSIRSVDDMRHMNLDGKTSKEQQTAALLHRAKTLAGCLTCLGANPHADGPARWRTASQPRRSHVFEAIVGTYWKCDVMSILGTVAFRAACADMHFLFYGSRSENADRRTDGETDHVQPKWQAAKERLLYMLFEGSGWQLTSCRKPCEARES
ncbi:hypothetical protein BC567DRAFT_235027 [Phyllosticta citribraziliensis]